MLLKKKERKGGNREREKEEGRTKTQTLRQQWTNIANVHVSFKSTPVLSDGKNSREPVCKLLLHNCLCVPFVSAVLAET